MNTVIEIFFIQILGFSAAYLLFLRKLKIPRFLVISTVCIYMSSPVFVVRSGITSALYISDFLLPFIILNLMIEKISITKSDMRIIIILIFLILILPFLSVIFGLILQSSASIEDENYALATVLWFYRALTYLSLFIYGIKLKLSPSHILLYFRMHLILSSILVLFGLMNYMGEINLAAFELLSTVERNIYEDNLDNSAYGYGFLGLYRATVGIWMATIIAMFFVFIDKINNRIELIWIISLITFSFIIMLLSFSRAAVLGLLSGILVLQLYKRNKFSHSIFVLFLLGGGWAISVAVPEVYDRLLSLQDASDDASVSRLTGWALAVSAITGNASLLLFGLGPASESAIFEIIGMFGAHNELVDAWLKLGTGGLVAELFLIYALIYRARVWHQKENAKARYASDIFIAIIAVNVVASFTQTSHLLQTYASHPWGVYIYLLYGVLLGAAGATSQVASQPVTGLSLRKKLNNKGGI